MNEFEENTPSILPATVKVLLLIGAVLSSIAFVFELAPIDWEAMEGDDWNLVALEGEPGKDYEKVHLVRCEVEAYETYDGEFRVKLWQHQGSYRIHLSTARVDENSPLAKQVYGIISDGKRHRMTLQLRHSTHAYIDFELVGVEKWK